MYNSGFLHFLHNMRGTKCPVQVITSLCFQYALIHLGICRLAGYTCVSRVCHSKTTNHILVPYMSSCSKLGLSLVNVYTLERTDLVCQHTTSQDKNLI